jgi:tetratricopeptide (TPR) repeat protein
MINRVVQFVVLIALLLFSGNVVAGDAGAETPFSQGAGARSLGLGGSFTSLATDATAIYYNPAGLGYLTYPEASFMHSALFEGTIYDFASAVYPISVANGLGVGLMRIGTDDIIRRDNYANRGKLNYSYSQILMSYGLNFDPLLGVGVSFKVVNQSIGDQSDFGVGLDVGLRSQIQKHLSIGVIARDLIPADLQLNGIVEQTPRSVMGGVSLKNIALTEHTTVSAAVDLEKFDDRSLRVHAGGELSFHQMLALRFGYDKDDFTFGAGLTRGLLRIDYAYKLHDYLEDTHHFSLSILLGRSVRERTAHLRAIEIPSRPLTEEEVNLALLKDRADSFFRRFELDSALVYYRKFHALDSTDTEVAMTIPAIEHAQRIQVEQEGRLRSAERDLEVYMQNFYARARVFYELRNYSAARDLLDLIFDIKPVNVQALQLKEMIDGAVVNEIAAELDTARIAERDGQIVRAIEAYNRILELDPDNQYAFAARQKALESLDWPQQLSLGISLFERGRLTEARRRFRTVLTMKPGEAVALEYLKKIEEPSEGQEPASLEDLQRNPRIWQRYLDGLRFMRNGEYENAIAEWEEILKVYPKNPSTLNNIEQARLRLETE